MMKALDFAGPASLSQRLAPGLNWGRPQRDSCHAPVLLTAES